MRILVTGANGMLGEKSTTLLAHQRLAHYVIATDLGERLLYPANVQYVRVDITDRDAVKQVIDEFEPEVIVNCAAYTDVDGAEKFREQAWNVNVEGVKNLISALNHKNAHLIHISSDYVFNGSSGPYREDDVPSPINFYGETKYASELALKSIPPGQIDWTIVRTNVLFGSSHFQEASFVNWVVKKLRNREPIQVVNDQYNNPTWADGLAQAIEVIISRRAVGIYHYGGLNYINRFEFALEIAAVFDLDPTLVEATTTRALKQVAKRPFRGGLITDKIKRELGVRIYSVKEALNSMRGK